MIKTTPGSPMRYKQKRQRSPSIESTQGAYKKINVGRAGIAPPPPPATARKATAGRAMSPGPAPSIPNGRAMSPGPAGKNMNERASSPAPNKNGRAYSPVSTGNIAPGSPQRPKQKKRQRSPSVEPALAARKNTNVGHVGIAPPPPPIAARKTMAGRAMSPRPAPSIPNGRAMSPGPGGKNMNGRASSPAPNKNGRAYSPVSTSNIAPGSPQRPKQKKRQYSPSVEPASAANKKTKVEKAGAMSPPTAKSKNTAGRAASPGPSTAHAKKPTIKKPAKKNKTKGKKAKSESKMVFKRNYEDSELESSSSEDEDEDEDEDKAFFSNPNSDGYDSDIPAIDVDEVGVNWDADEDVLPSAQKKKIPAHLLPKPEPEATMEWGFDPKEASIGVDAEDEREEAVKQGCSAPFVGNPEFQIKQPVYKKNAGFKPAGMHTRQLEPICGVPPKDPNHTYLLDMVMANLKKGVAHRW